MLKELRRFWPAYVWIVGWGIVYGITVGLCFAGPRVELSLTAWLLYVHFGLMLPVVLAGIFYIIERRRGQ